MEASNSGSELNQRDRCFLFLFLLHPASPSNHNSRSALERMRGELVGTAYKKRTAMSRMPLISFMLVEMFRERCYYHLHGSRLMAVVQVPHELCWYEYPLVRQFNYKPLSLWIWNEPVRGGPLVVPRTPRTGTLPLAPRTIPRIALSLLSRSTRSLCSAFKRSCFSCSSLSCSFWARIACSSASRRALSLACRSSSLRASSS